MFHTLSNSIAHSSAAIVKINDPLLDKKTTSSPLSKPASIVLSILPYWEEAVGPVSMRVTLGPKDIKCAQAIWSVEFNISLQKSEPEVLMHDQEEVLSSSQHAVLWKKGQSIAKYQSCLVQSHCKLEHDELKTAAIILQTNAKDKVQQRLVYVNSTETAEQKNLAYFRIVKAVNCEPENNESIFLKIAFDENSTVFQLIEKHDWSFAVSIHSKGKEIKHDAFLMSVSENKAFLATEKEQINSRVIEKLTASQHNKLMVRFARENNYPKALYHLNQSLKLAALNPALADKNVILSASFATIFAHLTQLATAELNSSLSYQAISDIYATVIGMLQKIIEQNPKAEYKKLLIAVMEQDFYREEAIFAKLSVKNNGAKVYDHLVKAKNKLEAMWEYIFANNMDSMLLKMDLARAIFKLFQHYIHQSDLLMVDYTKGDCLAENKALKCQEAIRCLHDVDVLQARLSAVKLQEFLIDPDCVSRVNVKIARLNLKFGCEFYAEKNFAQAIIYFKLAYVAIETTIIEAKLYRGIINSLLMSYHEKAHEYVAGKKYKDALECFKEARDFLLLLPAKSLHDPSSISKIEKNIREVTVLASANKKALVSKKKNKIIRSSAPKNESAESQSADDKDDTQHKLIEDTKKTQLAQANLKALAEEVARNIFEIDQCKKLIWSGVSKHIATFAIKRKAQVESKITDLMQNYIFENEVYQHVNIKDQATLDRCNVLKDKMNQDLVAASLILTELLEVKRKHELSLSEDKKSVGSSLELKVAHVMDGKSKSSRGKTEISSSNKANSPSRAIALNTALSIQGQAQPLTKTTSPKSPLSLAKSPKQLVLPRQIMPHKIDKKAIVTEKEDVQERKAANRRFYSVDNAIQNLTMLQTILFQHDQKIELSKDKNLNTDFFCYSLLYYVIRVVDNLKCYKQAQGVSSVWLDKEVLESIRNALVHHGAALVDLVSLLELARLLCKVLPSEFLQMTKPMTTESVLTAQQTQQLKLVFNVSRESIPDVQLTAEKRLESTLVYQILSAYHAEHKNNNMLLRHIKRQLIEIWLPKVNKMLNENRLVYSSNEAQLANVNKIQAQYSLHLPAIKMLMAICSDMIFYAHHDLSRTVLGDLLKKIRSEVAHNSFNANLEDVVQAGELIRLYLLKMPIVGISDRKQENKAYCTKSALDKDFVQRSQSGALIVSSVSIFKQSQNKEPDGVRLGESLLCLHK